MTASYNGRCLCVKHYAIMQYRTRNRLNKNIRGSETLCYNAIQCLTILGK